MNNRTFKSEAPFGVATKRFAKIGFHPELDVTGSMRKEISKLGPGSYNPKYPHCKCKKSFSWKDKVETEEFSKFLGFRNANILNEREFYKTLRGPGTNDINEALYKKQDSSVLENTKFGTGARFKNYEENENNPPPNTYFRNLKGTSSLTGNQFSTKPTFERDGFIDRFKSTEPNYRIPSNRYHLPVTAGIDARLKKVVSLRGPYDLFTGPRDGTTIKNHFGLPDFVPPQYFYVKPSDLDHLLKHPSKSRCGKFLKGRRMTKKPTMRCMLNDLSLCYKDPNDPGPAHYDLSNLCSIQTKKNSLYPFDTSKVDARSPLEWTIFPGPGRYSPKTPKCMKSKRPTWVFLSKVNREIFKVIDYRSF